MKKFANIVLAFSLVFSCSFNSGVDGFQSLEWGMSVEDVKNQQGWGDSSYLEPDASGIEVLVNFSSVKIAGERVVSRAYFVDKELAYVSNILKPFKSKFVKDYYSELKSKYGESKQGPVVDYEVKAIDLGANEDFYRSWENDTIVLTRNVVMGDSMLVLIYREKGIDKKLNKPRQKNRSDI